MSKTLSLQNGTLVVIYAPQAARQASSALIAQLALRGAVTVLDGGNRFQPYRIAHLLRRKTRQVNAAADRLIIRRAFTCYQMLALLQSTPALPQPYVVLDLLATFYDDHITSREASRLLDACLQQVQRLLQVAPVVVTLAPPLNQERAFLVERVCARADRVYLLEPSAPCASQLMLF